jgi:hypothetical protein
MKVLWEEERWMEVVERIRLIQKCVMLFVEITERGGRGNDVCGVTKEQEDGVDNGHAEYKIMC